MLWPLSRLPAEVLHVQLPMIPADEVYRDSASVKSLGFLRLFLGGGTVVSALSAGVVLSDFSALFATFASRLMLE